MKTRMDSEILVELLTKRGFSLNEEKNTLEYASGSISNYTKLTIYPPRNHWSLVKDMEVYARFIEYETFSSPGSIETDWLMKQEGYVAVDNLLNFLDEKNIRNMDVVKKERESKLLVMREKRAAYI